MLYNELEFCVLSWHAKKDVMFIRAIHQLAVDRLFACLAIILVFLLAVHQVSAQTTASISQPDLSKKNILILHSFSYEQASYLAMDPIFVRRFSDAGLDLNNVHFEFLDLGKHPSAQYWKEAAKSLQLKYEGRAVDLIILLHATGLDFLIKECKGLFPGVPVIHIIASTSFLREELRPDLERQLRSLNQPFIIMPFAVDAKATVEVILRLQPDTLKLIVLGGGGPLERRLEEAIRADLKQWQGSLEIEYLGGLSMDEALATVGMVPPKTAILFTTFYQDRTGKQFRPADAGRMISRAAKAPVFGLFETLLGDNGIVGGIMVNQGNEAERAASMALDIIRGTNLTTPLTVVATPLVPMFDRQQMDRWGFDEKKLPHGSIVINRPFSLWAQYWLYIIGGIVLILLQAFFIVSMLVERNRKKRAEESLRSKNEELDKFFNVSLDLLCVANTEGYFVRLNPAFEHILGYTKQELMTKPFLEFVHPDDRDATKKAMATLVSRDTLNDFSNRYRREDGTYRWLEWRAAPLGELIYAAARDITERKQSEEVIRKSEKKYRNLYESMMDGFVLVRMDGLIKEYNESYEEMTGYTHEELLKLTYRDLTPEKWHRFEQDIIEGQVMTRGYSDVYEKEYRKKDGTILPVELRTFLLRDEIGNNMGMWAIVRDVTERKLGASALEDRLRFERLVSGLSAGFVNIAPDQVDTEIEHGLKQILQFFQVERCGLIRILPVKGVWQATHAAVAEGRPPVPVGEEIPITLFPYAYDKLVNKRQVHSFSKLDDLPAEADIDRQTCLEWGIQSCLYIPVMVVEPDIQIIAIDSITGEQFWPEELIPRLQLVGEIFANALERKLMENKIHQAAEEWQNTFDAIPDIVMILDKEFRIVHINAAAKSFFGLAIEEIIGSCCYALMHDKEKPVDFCPFVKTMKSKGHEEDEFYDEARKVWFRISTDPIIDDSGEITKIIYTLKDITDQKRAEVEAFNARKELWRTDRIMRMGELTASLAHELNQPLTSILSNARAALRFIKADKLDMAELKEILEDISKDDKRAGDIIRSLRSMVKPDEGELEIIAVNDLLVETVFLFNSEAIMRNIHIKTEFDDSLPPVEANRVQFQQVVINLMMNAAESMIDEVERRIIVVQTRAIDDNTVRVAVRDFGTGIDEQELSRIFDPFFTTKRSGLGMGLSLSRSIIEAQAGHIWAENNPDGGATFCFEIPGFRE
jgi:two-component system, LuxR family, sensor kinase FixL